MNIEVRNVKHAAFASEETLCFSADIYVDGKKEGYAKNDGHGGSTIIAPYELRERIEAHAATLPEIVTDYEDLTNPSKKFCFQPHAEHVIDDLVQVELDTRTMRRKMKTHVLFVTKAEGMRAAQLYSMKPLGGVTVAATIERRESSRHLANALHILNTLPEADALRLYRQYARD